MGSKRKLEARPIRKPRLAPVAATASHFFAPGDSTFTSLGLDEEVVAALARAGFERPSHIQVDCADALGTGQTAVIASETGSGKTLAYVAPIASMLVRLKRKMADMEKPFQYHAVVLCPNLALCQQVITAVHGLVDAAGQPLLTAALVNSSTPPPFKSPDFILATPAGLLSFLEGAGGSYGPLWTQDGMQARVKHVVVDEADLMLTPAYFKALDRVLLLFRSGDRRRVEAKVFEELQLDQPTFARLPRLMQLATWRGGAKGLIEAGFKTSLPVTGDTEFGPYWRRQYVFVAATMPAITPDDVGSQIERFFPDATWIASSALHTSKPTVPHTWLQVGDKDWQPVLRQAITSDPDYQARQHKTLVFCKDARSADQLSEHLESEGVKHVVYHKNRPVEQTKQALLSMQQEPCGVMVCTDAAARGLDIQGVTHVVQADFAPNAIDFIHRIGRTGRAQRSGKVTSLYREHNVPLVTVLRQYVEEGRPLEAAFSRARSFSKKLKDRGGTFVPRGMTAREFQGGKEGQTDASKAPAADKTTTSA